MNEKERQWLSKIRFAAQRKAYKQLEADGVHNLINEHAPNFTPEADAEIKRAYAEGRWWPGQKPTEIKGLRNRRRVWGDVQEILRRIEVKNERGMRETLGSPEEELRRES